MKRTAVSTASAALLQMLSAQPAMADADLDRYFASGYTFCDAVILGDYWGESVGEAKSTIGRKIGWGNARIVAANINEARNNGQRCEFSDTGFSYEDAEALAQLWGVSVTDAKSALTDKVSLGLQALADDAVKEARVAQNRPRPAPAPRPAPTPRPAPALPPPTDWDRYAAGNFEFCDAAILSLYWRKSISASKAIIGRKLGEGRASSLDADIKDARRAGKRCQFGDTGYMDEDARVLSNFLGVSIGEAERQLADKVSLGDRAGADRLLNDARAKGQQRRRY